MNKIINKIKKYLQDKDYINITLNNEKLTTNILSYTDICSNNLIEFSKAFNNLFSSTNTSNNKLIISIFENDSLFKEAQELLNNQSLKETNHLKEFNKATITTSLAKCNSKKDLYIMKCYDYYIYLYDKNNKAVYMIIKNNKKANTMVNILILTPYLMYKELYAIHGGLVNKDNENILINNASLGGKTTFALLFLTNGWNIITEETTYITKEGNIFPYNIRNYFNIRVGTYLAFEEFFTSKGIINQTFLSMKGKSNEELFKYGKQKQLSIDFNELSGQYNLNNFQVTHSLKVSIDASNTFSIQKCNPTESVNSFLELSLAPTVMLFEELLDYQITDKEERRKELTSIFINTKSYSILSDFNYKQNYNKIIETINN